MKRRAMSGGRKQDENTMLLLHAEDFTDSSPYKRVITNSNTGLSSNGKFGNCFDFSSGKRILLPNEVLSDRINADWTIDFWLYRKSEVNNTPIIAAWPYYDYTLLLMNNGNTLDLFKGSGGGYANKIGTIQARASIWQHIALVNKSNTTRAYLNGILQCSGAASTASASPLYINYKEDTAAYSSFMLDEFRISNVARWTSDFIPPTKTY